MIGVILHVAISVSNMDEALAFYRDALGMEVVRDITLSGEKLSALVGLDGATIHNVALRKGDAEVQLLDSGYEFIGLRFGDRGKVEEACQVKVST